MTVFGFVLALSSLVLNLIGYWENKRNRKQVEPEAKAQDDWELIRQVKAMHDKTAEVRDWLKVQTDFLARCEEKESLYELEASEDDVILQNNFMFALWEVMDDLKESERMASEISSAIPLIRLERVPSAGWEFASVSLWQHLSKLFFRRGWSGSESDSRR